MKMIDDIRRENLADLVSEFGSLKALAAHLVKDESQVSQWLNGSAHSDTGKPRGMRADSARYIESKSGKPAGWLDQDHRAISSTPIGALAVPMFALKCSSCDQVTHQSFIQLEANDTIACPACGFPIVVKSYYGQSVLETILQGFGGAGFKLRNR